MAKYMLLIFGDEAQWAGKTPEQDRVHDAAHATFAATAGATVVGGEELEPASLATTLRSDGAGASAPPTGRSWRPRKRWAVTT